MRYSTAIFNHVFTIVLFQRSHRTSQLQSVVSYFIEFPSDVTLRNRLLEIDYCPSIEKVPTKCDECELEYETVDEIESHAQSSHDIPPKQCPICSQSFYSNLILRFVLIVLFQLSFIEHMLTCRDHMLSNHLSDPANVVAFLDAVTPAPLKTPSSPEKDKPIASVDLQCDLCGVIESSARFNTKHDCAVSFTRRLVVDGELVKCPGETVRSLI